MHSVNRGNISDIYSKTNQEIYPYTESYQSNAKHVNTYNIKGSHDMKDKNLYDINPIAGRASMSKRSTKCPT